LATTIIYHDLPFTSASAEVRGEDLWVTLEELTAATGWVRKPQGLCLGDRCVPIPPARINAFVSPDERFNLAEFARYLEQPVVHDDSAAVWLFGEAAATRRDALRSLQAPDFRLPDLDGALHALSDHRGKKVLLLTWASW
jgi:hypothetical protein